MLHHIVQADMYGEFGFHRLIRAFEELGSAYGVVKIVPFSHDVQYVSGVLTGGATPTMAWGATTVESVAKKWGWMPGVFKNENFDMRILNQMYGYQMLNSDAKFYKLGEIPAYEGSQFIRPVHDSKSFTGGLFDGEELEQWKKGLYDLRQEFTTLDLNTEVMVSSPKKIIDEGRFFVVDKRVVAGSSYRVGGRVLYRSVDDNPLFWDMRDYATRHCVASTPDMMPWTPAQAFVLDVAKTENGEFKIIEVNCINSAGFYDSNMTAVVKAVENLQKWPDTWRGTPWFDERCEKALEEWRATQNLGA